MPSAQTEVAEVRGTDDPPVPNPTRGDAGITPPVLEAPGTLDLEAKSVRDVSQAWDICKAIESSNISRAARTSDIQGIYDGQPPRSGTEKLEKGQNWQHNFSTRWLAGIVKPVVMRFVNGVTSQIYLTRSALPPNIPDWKKKSDLFQSKATRLFRLWKGFTPFINRLAVENVLQGYTYAVFRDQYTWKPKAYKQDRAYVPEESEQHAHDLQIFVAKEDWILSDFIALFTDEEAAKDNGFDIDNCAWAASTAKAKDPRDDATTTQFRKFQEMLVDGSLGATYLTSTPKVVKTFLLWNQEYDGSISFWIIERDSGRLLRFSYKLYEDMADMLAVFTLDPGNGSIHSSLGLGRYLASQAVVIERHRNRMLDNSMMAGLLLLKADPKDRARVATQVATPFIFVDKSIDIGEQQFESNSEGYIAADNLITSWAEQIAGVYVQAQIQANGSSDKTATEAGIDAARERELGDVVMRRWLDQMCDVIQIMQARAFRDDNLDEAERLWEKFQEDPEINKRKAFKDSSDPQAIQIIVECLQEGMTVDELKEVRENPASGFSHVDVAVIQAGINQIALQYKGDNRLDQNKLLSLDLESKVGPDVTRDLIIQDGDANVIGLGQRTQLCEIATMNDLLAPMPVLTTDDDKSHISTLIPMMKVYQAELQKNPNPGAKIMKQVELALNHLGAHLQSMEVKGLNKDPLFKVASDFYKGFSKDLIQVIQIQQHAQVAAEMVAQHVSAERKGQVPPAVAATAAAPGPGATPSAPPPGAPSPAPAGPPQPIVAPPPAPVTATAGFEVPPLHSVTK